MQQRVELAEPLDDRRVDGVDFRVVGHVARQEERIRHCRSQLFDILLEAFPLIGEREAHSF